MHPRDHRLSHHARVERDGSIIIPGGEIQHEASAAETRPTLKTVSSLWNITEDEGAMKKETPSRSEELRKQYHAMQEVFSGVRTGLIETTGMLIEESASQYGASFRDARSFGKSLRGLSKNGWKHLWAFLTQPVWVIQKNKEPKKLSRSTLFFLDVVRFGGTFAAIFVALFVALNFQSFSQIVASHLDPMEQLASGETADQVMKDKLLKIPSLATAGGEGDDLLSFLPDVGPPENRMIVPKLDLNIPLVTPSYDSLLKEDWSGVEGDIQAALEQGVVHYPGTARPGQAGNFFVTGHSSYYPWAAGGFKTVFARLSDLQPGDEYWVYYGGDKHRYVVQGKKEVKPSDVSVLDQPMNKRIGTLMTCTPVGTTLRRLIVTAQEVDPVTGVALEVGEEGSRNISNVKLEALPI